MLHDLKAPRASEELLSIRMYGPQAQKVFGELMATVMHELKVPKAFEELMGTRLHELRCRRPSGSSWSLRTAAPALRDRRHLRPCQGF